MADHEAADVPEETSFVATSSEDAATRLTLYVCDRQGCCAELAPPVRLAPMNTTLLGRSGNFPALVSSGA